MVFCNSEETLTLLTSIRVHGMGSDRYDNDRIGINGRIDSMQAAVLLAKFAIFPDELVRRQEAADRYSVLLADIDGLTPPAVAEGNTSVWAQYCVLARDTEHRTECMEKLKEAGVPSVIYYPKPLHLQKAFDYLGYAKGDFPVAEDVSGRIFALPMHPYLSIEDQEAVVAPLRG